MRTLNTIQSELCATNRAAKAAESSATTQRQAMLNVERPHILFENLKMFGFYLTPPKDSEPKPTFEEVKRISEQTRFPVVSYRLKNYGKSPAWARRWSIQFKSLEELPMQPQYDQQPVIGSVIPAGEAVQSECQFRPIGMTFEQWMAVLVPTSFLFVYGFIEYEDIFKEPPHHKSGFCYRWIAPSTIFPDGYWEPSGPESYWFYT